MNSFLVKLGAGFLLSIIILGGTYKVAYDNGKAVSDSACLVAQKKYQEDVVNQITILQLDLSSLGGKLTNQTSALSDNITQIVDNMTLKPVTIIKNGKCIPSINFIDSINEAILRVNQK